MYDCHKELAIETFDERTILWKRCDCLVRMVVNQSNVRNADLACSFPMTSGDYPELRREVSMTGYHNSSPSFYTEPPGVRGEE